MPADIILKDDDLKFVGKKIDCMRRDEPTAKSTVTIDPENGNLSLGDNGTDGDLLIFDTAGKRRVEISAEKNRARADRTIYINGQDPLVEVKHSKKNSSGVFPKITIGPTQIECKSDRGLPKFKLSNRGAVFSTQVSVIMGSVITISRDITIRKKDRSGAQKTVNVHQDITKLKEQIKALKQQVAELRRRL